MNRAESTAGRIRKKTVDFVKPQKQKCALLVFDSKAEIDVRVCVRWCEIVVSPKELYDNGECVVGECRQTPQRGGLRRGGWEGREGRVMARPVHALRS